MDWINSANPDENHRIIIKSEVDEIPSELMLGSENLRRPIKSEEDEISRPNDQSELPECYAIKTEEVHIYSVLPEEKIHGPSETSVRRITREDTSSKCRAIPIQTVEFSSYSTCDVKCPSEAILKLRELGTHMDRVNVADTLIDIQGETSSKLPEKEGSTVAGELSSNKYILKCYICTTVRHFEDDCALEYHLESFHPHKDSYECQECNIIIDDKTIFNRHLRKHDAELRPYKCDVCLSMFSKKSNLQQHEAVIHKIKNGKPNRRHCSKCRKTINVAKWDEHNCSRVIHFCLLCDLEFSSKSSLNKHVLDVHNTALVPRNTDASQVFRCYLCEPTTGMENEQLLQEHLFAVHPRQDVYHCEECNKYFQKLLSYNGHLQRHDDRIYPFKCGHCSLRFRLITNMWKHEVILHQTTIERTEGGYKKRRRCQICTKQIIVDKFEEHVETEHSTNINVLSTCEMELQSKNTLPIASVHNRLVLKCYLCNTDNVFEGTEHLQGHLQEAHATQSGYQCGKCNYSTTSVSCFNDHLTEHDLQIGNEQVTNVNDKALTPRVVGASQIAKCYLCKPATDMKDAKSLQEHLLSSHTPTDIYYCTECGKSIKKVTTYNKHLQRHDASLRPFKCSQCPFRFRRKDIMHQHEVDVHQVNNGWAKRRYQKRPTCRICKKRIICDKFEEHMRTEHPTNSHVS